MTGIKLAVLIWIVAVLFSIVVHTRKDGSDHDDLI